ISSPPASKNDVNVALPLSSTRPDGPMHVWTSDEMASFLTAGEDTPSNSVDRIVSANPAGDGGDVSTTVISGTTPANTTTPTVSSHQSSISAEKESTPIHPSNTAGPSVTEDNPAGLDLNYENSQRNRAIAPANNTWASPAKTEVVNNNLPSEAVVAALPTTTTGTETANKINPDGKGPSVLPVANTLPPRLAESSGESATDEKIKDLQNQIQKFKEGNLKDQEDAENVNQGVKKSKKKKKNVTRKNAAQSIDDRVGIAGEGLENDSEAPAIKSSKKGSLSKTAKNNRGNTLGTEEGTFNQRANLSSPSVPSAGVVAKTARESDSGPMIAANTGVSAPAPSGGGSNWPLIEQKTLTLSVNDRDIVDVAKLNATEFTGAKDVLVINPKEHKIISWKKATYEENEFSGYQDCRVKPVSNEVLAVKCYKPTAQAEELWEVTPQGLRPYTGTKQEAKKRKTSNSKKKKGPSVKVKDLEKQVDEPHHGRK
ncbi:MAG: hypothetical protein WCG27_10620, partial [Pseudomonadota bacterium]